MNESNETTSQMRGQVVRITMKENLKFGTPHNCHKNAAMYAIENDCNFVCGWLIYENSTCKTPHCICEKDGEYIDPTLNKASYFKIFHTYTSEEIDDIFYAEEQAFIPFIGNGESIYDGTRKLKPEELRDWWIYIANMQYEDCLVHH